jgi:chromosome segregation ATPase
MNDDQSQATLRNELRAVEEELAELRRTVREMRERLGDRTDPAGDAADIASVLTNLEEQDALIQGLEARRDQLRRRLGDT